MERRTASFDMFVESLNDDLDLLRCPFRISNEPPRPPGRITLLDGDGHPLGEIPDQADAATIDAFATILTRQRVR